MIASILGCAFVSLGVVWISHQPGTNAVKIFIMLAIFQLVLALLTLRYFQRVKVVIPLLYIVGSAVILRAIGLFGVPLFEDDYHRYLFDGFMTVTSGDPFSLPPSSFFASDHLPERVEELLSQINFPDIATVYGPVTQWIFAAAWTISPGSIWPFQLLAGLADILVLLVLARLCQSKQQRNYLILYAWAPLLIKEFVITAHPDIYAIAFCVLALSATLAHRWWIGGLLLALAVGAKVFALLIIPLVICYPKNFRSSSKIILGFLLGILLITLSFGTLGIWFPEGLGAMAKHWIFNAPLYRALFPPLPITVIKVFALVLLSAVIWWRMYKIFMLRGESNVQSEKAAALFSGLLWVYSTLLLVLPALNPWYVCWILPFAVLTTQRWPFVWATLITLAYHTGINVGGESLHRVSDLLLSIQLFGLVTAMLLDRYTIGSRAARLPTKNIN